MTNSFINQVVEDARKVSIEIEKLSEEVLTKLDSINPKGRLFRFRTNTILSELKIGDYIYRTIKYKNELESYGVHFDNALNNDPEMFERSYINYYLIPMQRVLALDSLLNDKELLDTSKSKEERKYENVKIAVYKNLIKKTRIPYGYGKKIFDLIKYFTNKEKIEVPYSRISEYLLKDSIKLDEDGMYKVVADDLETLYYYKMKSFNYDSLEIRKDYLEKLCYDMYNSDKEEVRENIINNKIESEFGNTTRELQEFINPVFSKEESEIQKVKREILEKTYNSYFELVKLQTRKDEINHIELNSMYIFKTPNDISYDFVVDIILHVANMLKNQNANIHDITYINKFYKKSYLDYITFELSKSELKESFYTLPGVGFERISHWLTELFLKVDSKILKDLGAEESFIGSSFMIALRASTMSYIVFEHMLQEFARLDMEEHFFSLVGFKISANYERIITTDILMQFQLESMKVASKANKKISKITTNCLKDYRNRVDEILENKVDDMNTCYNNAILRKFPEVKGLEFYNCNWINSSIVKLGFEKILASKISNLIALAISELPINNKDYNLKDYTVGNAIVCRENNYNVLNYNKLLNILYDASSVNSVTSLITGISSCINSKEFGNVSDSFDIDYIVYNTHLVYTALINMLIKDY